MYINDLDTAELAVACESHVILVLTDSLLSAFYINSRDFDITSRGVGVPISIAYTKGVFGGFNLEGAVLGARHAANKAFYDKTTSPREILVEKSVSVPADKVTMLPEVYDKLAKLSAGVQAEPSPAEQEKKSVAASAAEKAAESVHAEAGSEVVHVDAAAEAAKEASA